MLPRITTWLQLYQQRLCKREAERWKSEERNGVVEAEGQSLRKIWRMRLLLALKMGEGASSPEHRQPPDAGRDKETDSPPEPPEWALPTPWFRPSETTSDCDLQSCKMINCIVFSHKVCANLLQQPRDRNTEPKWMGDFPREGLLCLSKCSRVRMRCVLCCTIALSLQKPMGKVV